MYMYIIYYTFLYIFVVYRFTYRLQLQFSKSVAVTMILNRAFCKKSILFPKKCKKYSIIIGSETKCVLR